jgi:hypothetical protein
MQPILKQINKNHNWRNRVTTMSAYGLWRWITNCKIYACLLGIMLYKVMRTTFIPQQEIEYWFSFVKDQKAFWIQIEKNLSNYSKENKLQDTLLQFNYRRSKSLKEQQEATTKQRQHNEQIIHNYKRIKEAHSRWQRINSQRKNSTHTLST